MEVIILIGIAILVMAVVGLIHTLLWLGRLGQSKTPPAPVVEPPLPWQRLNRAQKLAVVDDVLGERMPPDLAAELQSLMPWHRPQPNFEPPAAIEPAASSAEESVAPLQETLLTQQLAPVTENLVSVVSATALPAGEVISDPMQATPAPTAVFDLGGFAAPADLAADAVTVDDSPLRADPETMLAAHSSQSRWRRFLSFENIIFLLAACLILGGTLYLVATTWDQVSSRWQHLYAELLVVGYGWMLLGVGRWLRRRLGLHPAATVLATIASLMAVAAAVLSAAAFASGLATGAVGSALVQLLASPAAGALASMHGRRRKTGMFFGAATLALSIAGLCLSRDAVMPATWIAALGVMIVCLSFLRALSSLRVSLLVSVLAVVAGVGLLPATLGAPAALVAPSLAVLAFACTPARRLISNVLAVVALVALLATAFALAFGSLPLCVAIAFIGLIATADLGVASPSRALFVLGAALTVFLSFAWTAAFGVQSLPATLAGWTDSPEQLARAAVAALGALPWILGVFAAAWILAQSTARDAVESVGYLIVALAVAVAALPFPRVGVAGGVALLALVLVTYANAAHRDGEPIHRLRRRARFVFAHLVGLATAFLLGRQAGPEVALVAVAGYSLVLVALRRDVGFWLGLVLVPSVAIAALSQHDSRWLPCAALALYTLALLLPKPSPRRLARTVILPAAVAALVIGLGYAGANETPFVAARYLSPVLVLAVGPAVLWLATGRAPLFILVEVSAALALAAVGNASAWSLFALLILLAGRDLRALQGAAWAALPCAVLAMEQGAGRFVPAAALGAAAALCLLRPLPVEAAFARWLGMPLAVFAAGTFCLTPATIFPWPPSLTSIPLVAALTAPFFLLALIRREPVHLVVESTISVALIVVAGIVASLAAGGGLLSALVAAAAALSLLFVHLRFSGLPDVAGNVAKALRRLAAPGFIVSVAAGVYLQSPWSSSSPASLVAPAMALAVLPFFAVAAVRHRPDFVAIDSVVLTVAIAIAALAYAIAGTPASPSAIASGVCALLLFAPVHERTHPARQLALTLFVAAFSALYARALRAPAELFLLALVAITVPFVALALLRKGPRFLQRQLVVCMILLAGAALFQGMLSSSGGDSARAAGTAALAALILLLVLGRTLNAVLARVLWIAVPLLCPVAAIPLTRTTMAWPAAIVAVAAIVVLCVQSIRRRDALMGAIAMSAGMVALAWAGLAGARPFAHGGDPARHLALAAILVATYGMVIGSRGGRISAATPRFLLGLETATVGLGHAVLYLGIGLRSAPTASEAVMVVVAFGALACAAVKLAFRRNEGWPFYFAESALGLSYGYLRVRTGWLDGVADLDSLAACVLAFVNLGIARTLGRWRAGLGARESQMLATLLPLVSALFLRTGSPVHSLGTFAAAATYAWLARTQKRPWLAWAAGALANVGLIPIWLHYGVHSPMAFALPVGVTLGLLGRVYQDRLGKHGPLVRSLASLLVFGATSYQMFQFSSVWPALILALSSIAAVLLGIAWRVRAYLYLGFASLVLDIVTNLTRWSVADRLRSAIFGLAAGMALLAMGVLVAHHKKRLLDRFRSLQTWTW